MFTFTFYRRYSKLGIVDNKRKVNRNIEGDNQHSGEYHERGQQPSPDLSGDALLVGRDRLRSRSGITRAIESAIAIGDLALVDISETGTPAESVDQLRAQIRAALGLSK